MSDNLSTETEVAIRVSIINSACHGVDDNTVCDNCDFYRRTVVFPSRIYTYTTQETRLPCAGNRFGEVVNGLVLWKVYDFERKPLKSIVA